MSHQAPLFITNPYIYVSEDVCIKNCITDRWSKYTVTALSMIYEKIIEPQARVKDLMKQLSREKFYRKATHNTYAWRLIRPDWVIVEGMHDDGETGAAKCIMRELQIWWVVNGLVIVTRYYGWVMLHADRFRHVVDATKLFVKKLKNE